MLRLGHHVCSLYALCFFELLLLGFLTTGRAIAEDRLAVAVKVAFVANFAHFTTWPDDAFADAVAPIDLFVYGGERTWEAFGSIDGKPVGARKIRVRLMRPAETVDRCHMMFFDQDVDRSVLSTALATVKNRPVLTVGETPDFINLGGVINISIKNDRFHFEIEPVRASRRGLKISSRLLKLATILDD